MKRLTLEKSTLTRHAFEPMVTTYVRVLGHAGNTESGWAELTIVSWLLRPLLVQSSDDTSNLLHCVKAL